MTFTLAAAAFDSDLERALALIRLFETLFLTLILVMVGLMGVLWIVMVITFARRLSRAAGEPETLQTDRRRATTAGDAWTQAGRRVEVEPGDGDADGMDDDDEPPWSRDDDS